MQHRQIVAWTFRIAGLVLGVPSLILALMFGGSLFELMQKPAQPASHALDIKTYGLVGLLQNGAIGLAKTLDFTATAGLWLAIATASVAIVVGLFALILYLTGRGIARHATWARIFAGLISIVVLLAAWSAIFSVPRDFIPVAGVILASTLYALWVLVWRYT